MVRIYSFLMLGVVIVSSSAVLIRWAEDVSSPVIALYRLVISGSILLAWHHLRKNTHQRYEVKFHWHFILAGLFLALHFITWIAALKLTSIANAIFLGSTHPIFAVIASIIFLKEFPGKKSYPLFLLSMVGIFLIVWANSDFTSGRISGDISALFSALFFALYILVARMHRQTVHIINYLGMVYLIAAFFCLIFVLFRGDPLSGFSDQSWLMLLLLALGPSLMGHSLLNWASRHLEIFKVNLAMLLEPIIATVAGMLLFFEFPGQLFYAGALLIMFSLIYLMRIGNKKETDQHSL